MLSSEPTPFNSVPRVFRRCVGSSYRRSPRFSNRYLVPHSATIPPLNLALLKAVFSRLFMPPHFLNPNSRNPYPVGPRFYRRPGEYVGRPQTGVAAIDPLSLSSVLGSAADHPPSGDFAPGETKIGRVQPIAGPAGFSNPTTRMAGRRRRRTRSLGSCRPQLAPATLVPELEEGFVLPPPVAMMTENSQFSSSHFPLKSQRISEIYRSNMR
jgi:hypothetical protein